MIPLGKLFLVVLTLGVLESAGEAAERVLIRDIQSDPGKYLNMTLQIRGEIVQVTSEGQPTRGNYVLRDESERTISVRSRDLPAPGRVVVVEGQLTQDAGVTTYYLREQNRWEAGFFTGFFSGWGPWEIAVVGASAVVAVLLIALVVVLVRPGGAPAAAIPTPRDAEPTVALPSSVVDELSRRPATTRLPAIPAEVEVLTGPKTGTRAVLPEESVFGRSGGLVPLEDMHVSGEQAKITFKGDRYELTNRSDANPTRVNGEPIQKGWSVDLKDGDELLMGTVKLKFRLLR